MNPSAEAIEAFDYAESEADYHSATKSHIRAGLEAAYAIDFAYAQRTIQALAGALDDCEKWLDGQPRRSECKAETQVELLGSVRAALDTARKGGWIK